MLSKSVKITIHVKPNASKTEVVGVKNGVLEIRVAAPPVDGKANEKLVEFLSERLRLRKSNVVVEHGMTARTKIVSVTGIGDEALKALLYESST